MADQEPNQGKVDLSQYGLDKPTDSESSELTKSSIVNTYIQFSQSMHYTIRAMFSSSDEEFEAITDEIQATGDDQDFVNKLLERIFKDNPSEQDIGMTILTLLNDINNSLVTHKHFSFEDLNMILQSNTFFNRHTPLQISSNKFRSFFAGLIVMSKDLVPIVLTETNSDNVRSAVSTNLIRHWKELNHIVGFRADFINFSTKDQKYNRYSQNGQTNWIDTSIETVFFRNSKPDLSNVNTQQMQILAISSINICLFHFLEFYKTDSVELDNDTGEIYFEYVLDILNTLTENGLDTKQLIESIELLRDLSKETSLIQRTRKLQNHSNDQNNQFINYASEKMRALINITPADYDLFGFQLSVSEVEGIQFIDLDLDNLSTQRSKSEVLELLKSKLREKSREFHPDLSESSDDVNMKRLNLFRNILADLMNYLKSDD